MKKITLFACVLFSIFQAGAQSWSITGNTGTSSATNFLGTTDDVDLVFKRWGGPAGLLSPVNTSFGVGALNQASPGSYNTAVGVFTLASNTSGLFNTGTGFNTLIYNSTGFFNTATGASTLYSNTTGSANTASGFNALFQNTNGSYNTVSGHEVMAQNTVGNYNCAFGYAAGGDITIGNTNIFLGFNTGRGITTGSANVIIGGNVTGLPSTLYNTIILADGSGNQRIYVDNNGKVRIGDPTLTLPGTYKLFVEEGILTEKVKVAVKSSADWSDYVFEPGYNLLPLAQVEAFTKTHKHLPGVPAAPHMVQNGLDVAQMDAKLLEKIEELTLYLLDMNRRMEKLETENANLKAVVEKVKK